MGFNKCRLIVKFAHLAYHSNPLWDHFNSEMTLLLLFILNKTNMCTCPVQEVMPNLKCIHNILEQQTDGMDSDNL